MARRSSLLLCCALAALVSSPVASASTRDVTRVLTKAERGRQKIEKTRARGDRAFRRATLRPIGRELRAADAVLRRAKGALGYRPTLDLVITRSAQVWLSGDRTLKVKDMLGTRSFPLGRRKAADAAWWALVAAGYGDDLGDDAADSAALERLSPATIATKRDELVVGAAVQAVTVD